MLVCQMVRPKVLHVNGSAHDVGPGPGDRLIDVLRDVLGLRGTKEACGDGECGSCTVLVDGRPTLSCITLAVRVTGAVETIEGLAAETASLRANLADLGGVQCGFCTPGQVVSATALLRGGGPVSDDDIRRSMGGNICRCTGYEGIVAAVRRTLDEARA